jgi:ferric-dicitrate binding protein FerR (iron transport regulator)
MSEREPESLTPAEQEAQQSVRALPEVEASAEFRDRLRRQFVDGFPGVVERRPARVTPIAVRFGLPLALAATLAALVFTLNRGPAWTVSGFEGAGTVYVAGKAMDAGNAPEFARALRPGVSLRADDEMQLDLMSAGHVALQLAPGAEVTLPKPPGRWFGREVSCTVKQGEVRFVTGPRFPGSKLRIGGPSAGVEVTGTTLAVIVDAMLTCVCVLDGEVRVMMMGTNRTEMVTEGHRCTVQDIGAEPEMEEISDMERMKLTMLRDAAAPALGKAD